MAGTTQVPGGVPYDASGDVLNDGSTQYLYDAEGRVCASANTPAPGFTTMTGYVYDADGLRVAKGTITQWSCDPGASGFTTVSDYVLGPGGEQVAEYGAGPASGSAPGALAWQHSNVWAAGKLLATYDKDGLHFYLDDPLGSRRVQTDFAGATEQTCSSLPFGDSLSCTGSSQFPTEHHFTGKERDAESGLDYFGARYYSSSLARFMSPDWSAKVEPVPYSKLDDPQTLNLYAYVNNNPVTGVDPDGHREPSDPMQRFGCSEDEYCGGSAEAFNSANSAQTTQTNASAQAAQQQMGDPTLPTEVAPPPPSLLDTLGSALAPQSPLDAALLFGTEGLGELPAALARVLELSSAMGKTADFVTLAVTETKEGTTVVSSSEKALRPVVKGLLKDGEVAAKGAGHAEVTGVNAARQMGLTPTGVAASRGVCPSCAEFLINAGISVLSALRLW